MSDNSANNKRIAKNTLMLYIRMLLVMAVTLYTSRVILQSLGIVDYGLYNVIGGMTLMFGFFQSSLSNATQRYLNVELGRNDHEGVNRIFSLSQLIYFAMSVLVVIVAEIIGLWFIYNKLTIPPDRLDAALWVFHTTVISLFFTLNGIVYNSMLIANENMKAYAYLGIIEVVLKLLIAFALFYSPFDRLKLYSVLFLLVTLSVQSFYAATCLRKYKEAHFHFYWNKNIFREMFAFMGWNTIGTAAWALNHQGINILFNIFFGPVVNAANGIASQVNSAVTKFSMNFYTAVQPQIVKSYAAGDYDYFRSLIYNSSRYSFYLMWLLCLPIMLRIDYILELWLGNVPESTNQFVIWTLIYSLIYTLTTPFWIAIQAVGNLKKYILWGNAVYLLAFPISFLFLKLNFSAVTALQVLATTRLLYLIVTISITNKFIRVDIKQYIQKTIFPIIQITTISYILSFVSNKIFPQTFWGTLIIGFSTLLYIAFSIYTLGITKQERNTITSYIKKKINKQI